MSAVFWQNVDTAEPFHRKGRRIGEGAIAVTGPLGALALGARLAPGSEVGLTVVGVEPAAPEQPDGGGVVGVHVDLRGLVVVRPGHDPCYSGG